MVTVPPGAAVVVDGEAVVPSGWEAAEGGSRSPAAPGDGEAWRLMIQGDVPVTIREG